MGLGDKYHIYFFLLLLSIITLKAACINLMYYQCINFALAPLIPDSIDINQVKNVSLSSMLMTHETLKYFVF